MAEVNCNNFQIGVYLSKALFRFAQIAQLRYNLNAGVLVQKQKEIKNNQHRYPHSRIFLMKMLSVIKLLNTYLLY